jgi:hypothetical protein
MEQQDPNQYEGTRDHLGEVVAVPSRFLELLQKPKCSGLSQDGHGGPDPYVDRVAVCDIGEGHVVVVKGRNGDIANGRADTDEAG